MVLRSFAMLAVLLGLLSGGYGLDKGPKRVPLPSTGVVPDAAVAVKIGEAVFPPIFGVEEVAKYVPYHATLQNGIWTVYGTLPQNARGGTPMMTIQKSDGKVIEIWHSQ